MKKIYRSETDSIIGGVIGGTGEYFTIDPTVLRIGFVVLVLLTGIFPGIVAYIIAYFLIPERPMYSATPKQTEEPARDVTDKEVPQTMTHISEILDESHTDEIK